MWLVEVEGPLVVSVSWVGECPSRIVRLTQTSERKIDL